MYNWKHTVAAVCAVFAVATMSVLQYSGSASVMADEVAAELEVLQGDGSGETPAFADYEDSILAGQIRAETFEPQTGYIIYTDGKVNVREYPTKDSTILTMLEFGESMYVRAVSSDNLWYEVELSDGTVGNIMCDLISFSYDEIKAVMLTTTMYETATVSVSGGKLNVRNKPSDTDSVVVSQLPDKAIVYICEICDDGWLKVIYGSDYDTGYILSDFVIEGEMIRRADVDTARADRLESVVKKGVVVTNVSAVNVRNAPSVDADAIGSLKNGENVKIIAQGSKWTKILTDNGSAYVIASAIMDSAAFADYNVKKAASIARAAATQTDAASSTDVNATIGARIIAEAEKYLGVKYVYGGNSPSGFDCSGFVQYTLKKVGISVNRSSRDQYKNGYSVSRAQLSAGDLVFFSRGGSISHVGIYAGNGKVIHSPSPGKVVTYTTLEHMCSYSTYVGARRIY